MCMHTRQPSRSAGSHPTGNSHHSHLLLPASLQMVAVRRPAACTCTWPRGFWNLGHGMYSFVLGAALVGVECCARSDVLPPRCARTALSFAPPSPVRQWYLCVQLACRVLAPPAQTATGPAPHSQAPLSQPQVPIGAGQGGAHGGLAHGFMS